MRSPRDQLMRELVDAMGSHLDWTPVSVRAASVEALRVIARERDPVGALGITVETLANEAVEQFLEAF